MTISGLDDALTDWVVVRRIFGIPLAFYYALALVAAIWYFFGYTYARTTLTVCWPRA